MTLLIEGRVQGVGFRWYVMRRAARWPSITGYVRNTPDGRVEVVAEGPIGDLLAFGAEVKQGPPESLVTNVQTEFAPATGAFHVFEIRM
jgi:acylphosphatase